MARTAQNPEQALGIIAWVDLDAVIDFAWSKAWLLQSETDEAQVEYRHFLYLAWLNRSEGNRLSVVPTKRADAIWHAHMLHSEHYREMCDKLFGEYLDHKPGLEEGTAPFNEAVVHTKLLQDRHGSRGFCPNYFDHVDTSRPDDPEHRKRKDDTGGGGVIGGNDSGKSTDAPADAGVGDGGGGCGGGGCGGCGG